ncbi:MAG: phytoene desaturase family protein [Bacteroidales bacterium]
MNRTALVVGAGLGGLTTALRLRKNGYDVTIVEKYKQAGGRLNVLKKDGFTFDFGPSFFSMSYEFREFFDYIGKPMPFRFVELDPLYTVNFSGSDRFYIIYKDLKKLAQEFSDVEPNMEEKLERLLQKTGKLYHDVEYRIIKRNFNTILGYVAALTTVPMQHAPLMLRNVWNELNRYFTSYEAKVIFSLVAFFLGATPFDTPAVYTLLSYIEMKHDGYYNVEGGMYKIVEGLLQLMQEENIEIHYNTEITGFVTQNGKISALLDSQGKKWTADLYVINSDAAWFRGKVFGRKKYQPERLDKEKWTLGPFTMYLGVKGRIAKLAQHNYFLGTNFQEYASKIFKNSITLDKPYYYVNVPSKTNPNVAPEGHENLFILCPVPDLRYKPDWSDRDIIASNILKDLSQRIGFDIEKNLVSKTVLTPIEWQNAFNLYRGSGLGLAHDLNQIGAFRPRNVDEEFSNVFYVGASTVPGTGLPMAVISSKLVTERILQRYGTL